MKSDAIVRHFEQAIAVYNPQAHRQFAHVYGIDLAVITRRLGALVLWLLGFPALAAASSQAALALAQQLAHLLSLRRALYWSTVRHHMRREGPLTQARDEAAMSIAIDQEFS